MQLITLCFISTLLLQVLSSPIQQFRQSPPAMDKLQMTDSCILNARTLLRNITNSLKQANLFSGLDCTKQNMELSLETSTPSVCSPKESTCYGNTKSDFDEDSCLTNIGNDLTYYYNFLWAQPDPEDVLRSSVLRSLKELMENCFKLSLPTDLVSKEASDRPSTYNERLSLCKVLRGFQVRTIMINRAISYINSGDHMK